MGKKGKKAAEIARIPLPTSFKNDQRDAEEENDLEPGMKNLLANFKSLCRSDKQSDFIKFSAANVTESTHKKDKDKNFSCSLDPGLSEEDKYLTSDTGGVVTSVRPEKDGESQEDDYSGAKKAVITEKVSKKKLKKLRAAEREKTKGAAWFDMPALEMTDERKNDLELLKMRGVLDPKRFYKKSDTKELPKYFQIGTVVDSPYDYYSDRIPTKARKRTMVDELLADAEFKKYNKRKYVEIIEAKQKKERKFKSSGAKKKKVQ
eukprot:TRINITY_DN7210_c0_g1_i4.p1 TRINITY_DN7210_c0_g1~~TRINITY_DN7210_c0_g1_i4.p1  ORF type:complete len:262 (-),score=92.92 TRINITY_DN7210_c0_g1_i4:43-828(-)